MRKVGLLRTLLTACLMLLLYPLAASGTESVVPDSVAPAPRLPDQMTTGLLVPSTISNVQVTNVSDKSFSVSWLTDVPASGHINYGVTPALGSNQSDDPDAGTYTHHVTVSGLSPNTTYYFDVVSDGNTDDNGGAHHTAATGPTLGIPSIDTIYGQVFHADGTTPAEGTIVYITLFDDDGSGSPGQAAELSSLVDSSGYWNANLGNARLVDLSAYFEYSASADSVTLLAKGATEGCASQTVDTNADSPAVPMTLCYLFGDLDCDRDVDVDDIMQVASQWRCKCGDACYDPTYDLDNDCDIDIVDIMLVVAHWGETCG